MEIAGYILLFIIINIIIYDKFIQREHQLLINYPFIGRFRYFFEALREPFRQYFGDEDFYESKDKVDWVYDAAHGKTGYASFSPSQPQPNPKFLIKHANAPLNDDEVDQDFSVTFGKNKRYPFITKSIIGRSAMSDGAISPEGTRSFVKGSFDGQFPINTGEGSLTTNFFFTHKNNNEKYVNKIEIKGFDKILFKLLNKFLNTYNAIKYFRKKLINEAERDTYIFDHESYTFFRPNWDAPLENFPSTVPEDMPDIIFQMSSGLYGVRDQDGNFDPIRYKKTMSFCRMTEIKLAQGAKQTGGKLAASKVTDSVAYFRGVKPNEPLMSPNRFPYASSINELFDFVAQLQELSQKPVGIKIVISGHNSIEPYAIEMQRRKEQSLAGIPDFINIDGGDGGSATAPLFLMDRVGFHIKDAIFIADTILKQYNVREDVKLIAGSKILTPDDVVIVMSLGADFVNIGRAFMMSAGCIRARMCSGHGSHQCPVGLATSNPKLREAYLVYKNSDQVKKYHENLIAGIKTILAVMGLKNISELTNKHITFIDKNGFIHNNINRYLDQKTNG